MTPIIMVVPVVFVVVLVATILVVRNQLHLAAPNEALIISGRARHLPDNKVVGYRIVQGGRVLMFPFLERLHRLDLSLFSSDVSAEGICGNHIPLLVEGAVTARIDIHSPYAPVYLLGVSREELVEIVGDSFSGATRRVLSSLSPEDAVGDVDSLTQAIIEEMDDHLRSLGLQVDALHIASVRDDVGYLEALGLRAAWAEEAPPGAGVDLPDTMGGSTFGGDRLGFLPAPAKPGKRSVSVQDTDSGKRHPLALTPALLSIGPKGAAVSVALDEPFQIVLGFSESPDGDLLHVDLRQQRLGVSIRMGVSSTVASFSSSVRGLSRMSPRYPRLDEEEMLWLLSGLRWIMQTQGEELWG